MSPFGSRPALLACAFLLACQSACQSADVPHSVAAGTMLERMRRVEVGQSVAEVHAILKDDPVRKPGHPQDPFPTPLHRITLHPPDRSEVVLETYVVATRPEKGCPDFLYEDVPVVFVDGVVAVRSWEEVEWRWRGWGGGLDRLRWLQDRHRCPADLEGPEV